VGAHGGALAFGAFLPPGAALIELSPTGWRQQCNVGWDRNPYSLYGSWCASAGLRHKCLMDGGIGFMSTIRNLEAGRAIVVQEAFLQGNISLSATDPDRLSMPEHHCASRAHKQTAYAQVHQHTKFHGSTM